MTVTLEQVEDLVTMLTGGDTGGVHLAHQPALTREQAFSVLYYLQEVLFLVPNHYEMCAKCKLLYDSGNGGGVRQEDNALLCGDCAQGYDMCESCGELVPYDTTDDGECAKCQK
jgi:hypothetical protein